MWKAYVQSGDNSELVRKGTTSIFKFGKPGVRCLVQPDGFVLAEKLFDYKAPVTDILASFHNALYGCEEQAKLGIHKSWDPEYIVDQVLCGTYNLDLVDFYNTFDRAGKTPTIGSTAKTGKKGAVEPASTSRKKTPPGSATETPPTAPQITPSYIKAEICRTMTHLSDLILSKEEIITITLEKLKDLANTVGNSQTQKGQLNGPVTIHFSDLSSSIQQGAKKMTPNVSQGIPSIPPARPDHEEAPSDASPDVSFISPNIRKCTQCFPTRTNQPRLQTTVSKRTPTPLFYLPPVKTHRKREPCPTPSKMLHKPPATRNEKQGTTRESVPSTLQRIKDKQQMASCITTPKPSN
jgi:hypothetical protein